MTEHRFETRQEASLAAAGRMAELLNYRLEHQPLASFVVSGGTTPLACFEALSATDLDWGRVQVLLSDERWVPADDPDSNEKLARESLLVDELLARLRSRPGFVLQAVLQHFGRV